MSHIIGLIGGIASGKTAVADYLLREKGASYYRFSDVLRDVLKRLHKPETRENLQELGLSLRKAYGDGLLAQVLKEDVLADGADIIVVDGIRYQDEFEMVKGLGGRIVYVCAPQKVRYGRATSRGTRGEAKISFEEFRKSEERETERMIESLGKMADVVLENTGTLSELKAKIEESLFSGPSM
ncbi:MAG: AAA family ATPase [Candidatus Altiarchaeota archaeon]